MAKKPVILPLAGELGLGPAPAEPAPKARKPAKASDGLDNSTAEPRPDNAKPPVVNPQPSIFNPQPGEGAKVLPRIKEFRPIGEPAAWRVERFDLLAVEFGLEDASGPDGPKDLQQFVFLCQRYQRLWLLVRRLYGIAPVIPPPNVDLDDLRIHTRAEMEAAGYAVKTELDALRSFWLDYCRKSEPNLGLATAQDIAKTVEGMSVAIQNAAAEPRPGTRPGTGELALDDKVLEEFGFSERLFEITVWDPTAKEGRGANVPRPAAENKVERARFIAKIHEWRKMLEDSIGGPLARSAMMNEMTLRRLDAEIAVADPKQREPLYKQRDQETKAYQNAVEDLQRMFPEMAVAGRVSFRGVISDLVVGHQDYYGNGDRKLMDKVFTATEIEWLLRAAVQVEARFRFSLNLAIIDCINGLYDPNFRPRLKPRVLKQMDAASKAVLDAGRAASGDKLVDLENGVMPGEGDDFEDFNDADCPHCGGRISSQAKRCPECRRVILWKEQDANEHENQKEETNTAASAGAGAAAAGDGGAGAPGI